MTDVETRFIEAYQNWATALEMRPDSGVYPGQYQDYIERSQISADGSRRVTLTPVPHEQQALDFKTWKLYVYARDAYLASLASR